MLQPFTVSRSSFHMSKTSRRLPCAARIPGLKIIEAFASFHSTISIMTESLRFQQIPGYLFRRLHQIAVARFALEAESFGLTPLQWAALEAISRKPGVDQSALSRDIALDTSTVAGVIYRLEARGLVARRASANDRRLRILDLTDDGHALLGRATPVVMDMQQWLLEPLAPEERTQFMESMLKIVHRSDE